MAVRYSKQREAVLDYVKSVVCHPTADEVFANVRVKIPNISLGTVYRNLSLLVSQGEIDVIKSADGADRFDGNTKVHNHVVCRKCGKVCDVFELPDENEIDRNVENLCDYKQIRHTVVFTGLCPDCAE